MSDSMTLRQYIHLGLKWWWLIILAAVIAASISYGISQRQVPVYQAKVTLIVGQSVIQSPNVSSSDLSTSQEVARTYADMTLRQPVLVGVVETLSLSDSWEALKERVQAKPVPGTQLLELTVEASSPEEAQVTADELARQLIKLSPTELQNREQGETQRLIRQRLENLQVKIDAGQARRAALETAMSGTLSAEQAGELQAEINDLEGLLVEWENNHTQLLTLIESTKAPNYLAVIESARANPRPIRPQVFQFTLLGGVVGLFLALGLVFLIEYLDDTFKSPADL